MALTLRQIKSAKKLKGVLVACTALSAWMSTPAMAQLSIMGVLDTRPVQNRPAPQPTLTNQAIPEKIVPTSNSLYPRGFAPTPQQKSAPASPSGLNATPGEEATGFSANEIGFHQDLNVITARGDVEILYGEQILIADTVSYNQNKDIVTASGNVQIVQESGEVAFADFIEIKSNLRDGIIKNLRLILADRSTITAQQAARSKGRFTIAKDAEYSPCAKCKDDPDRALTWKLSASKVLHDQKEKRVEYSDVFLKFYDIPVAYFPYFSHPDPTLKRETGFLAPSFGSRGSLEGFATTPFFYNFSPSKDLTITPTYYYSIKQPHLGLEYRQHTDDGEFTLAGTMTYADGGPGATAVTTEEFRGHIDSDGLFDIDETWRWGFDLNHASDETYIRRYQIEDQSENSHLTSSIYVEGFRARNYIKADIKAYQEQRDFTTNDLQDGKVEYQFSHLSQPQKTGAYWKLDGNAYGINNKNRARTTRLSGDLSYLIPHTSSSGDIVTLDMNVASAGYYVSNYSDTNNGVKYSGFQGRMVPSMSLEWRKPLTRPQLGGKAYDIFEPIVKVKAAPNVGANDKIPNEDSQDFEFDDTNLFKTNRYAGLDLIDGGNRVDFGFNWGIYGNNGGYSQMFIGQSYRQRKDSTYDINSGHEDQISDIVGRVEVRPSDFISALYRYRLDKDDLDLNRSETQLVIGPESTRFSLSHLYIEGTGLDSEYGTREEIYGSLENQITKNWYSKINGRYRMNNPEGTVSYGGEFGYQDECITVYLGLNRNFAEDRDIEPTDTIGIRIELKNLGGFSAL